MKKKVLALSIVLILATVCLTSLSFTQAATSDGQWITDYTIENAETGQVLIQYDAATNETTRLGAVVPGSEVTITFTVNVIATGEGNLKLTSGLGKPASGLIWVYDDVYDLGSTFSPNAASTTFNWNEGEFQITLNGKVPSTSSAAKAFTAVTLAGPSGTALDKIAITATSAEMDNFLSLLDKKQDELRSLKSSGVDTGYTDMYSNILTVASAVAEGGDVGNAIALLDGLGNNAPAGSFMQIAFYPIVGVTAVVAVLFLVLFLRNRGKVSYMQLVVEDQIKDLEGLSLRISKIDRASSSSLESVKDRLKQLVGM